MEVSGESHAVVAVSLGKNLGTHWIGGWVDMYKIGYER
jgi:hypothetical protein